MTRRSRRPRDGRRRESQRERSREDRRRRRRRTGIRTLDEHASWRDVYAALDAALGIEPDDTGPDPRDDVDADERAQDARTLDDYPTLETDD